MKNIVRGLAALASLGATASALDQLRVGDSAELFLTAGIEARTDSNIFLSDVDELSDTIFELAPGLELVFGAGSQTRGKVSVKETFTHYVDNDELNEELFSGGFEISRDDGKLKLGAEGSFRELNQNTRDVRGPFLVRRDQTHGFLDSELQVSEKTGSGLALSYDKTAYKTPGYIDSEEFAVPFNYYYRFAPKADASFGLRYRETSLSGGVGDSKDFYYNIGARGEFTPKLSGRFSVGYNQRDLDRGGDESSLGADADLAYLLTPKTKLGLILSNDYATSPEGDSQRTLTASTLLSTNFTSQWEGSIGVTFQNIEYFGGRQDDYYDASIGATYALSETMRFGARYSHRENSSDLTFVEVPGGRVRSGDFTSDVFSLTADLRF